LIAYNFQANIPEGSRIDGVEARFERHGGDGTDVLDNVIRIGTSYPDAVEGDNKSAGATWISTDPDSYETFGGATDLWGLVLTTVNVNSTGFGVAVQAVESGAASSPTAHVDHMQVKIYYTAGAGSGGSGSGGGGGSPGGGGGSGGSGGSGGAGGTGTGQGGIGGGLHKFITEIQAY
jgi:hypothetical protein